MQDERRPRIGLVVPSAQVVTEPLFNAAKGDQWDFVTSRVLLRGARAADLQEMEHEISRAATELSTARVDALASCCTASGAISGAEKDEATCREIAQTVGAPVTSTMLSIVANLRALGARLLTVVTPYVGELATVEHQYLEDNGFRVVSHHDGEIDDPFEMSTQPVQEIIARAREAWAPEADAVLLSCMNWPTHRAIEVLQAETGIPVVTSHSATLWNLERLLGATA